MRAIVWTLVLIVGCDLHGHDHTEGPNKQEEPTAQVTVWGERFEIFLEHKPIVSTQPADFLTHVTDLTTGQPRREGKITFVLTPPAGVPVEHAVDAPLRPGIYIARPVLTGPGPWTATVRIPVEGVESAVELPGFLVFASPEEARKALRPGAPEGITFLKEQQWRLGARIEPAGVRRMVERLRIPAVVSATPGGRVVVTPPVAGRLLAPPGKSAPALGARVDAGDVLAFIQPPWSDLAARLVEAEAEGVRTRLALVQAERAHTRVKKLAAAQAKTERELQESEFALQTAGANYEAALALKTAYEKSGAVIRSDVGNLPVFELRAPISGIVTRVGAAPGEYVPADQSLFTILDSRAVLIEARVPESDVARIGPSRQAVYETPDDRGRFVPIHGDGGGRLVLFGLEVDPATRTVPLVYLVPNPDARLRIGMALTLHLETARTEEAVAIPESALVDEEGRYVTFVQVSGETFRKRDLNLGIRDSGFVQVLEGISPGERVVTRGAYAVRLASVSTSLPAHGHAH